MDTTWHATDLEDWQKAFLEYHRLAASDARARPWTVTNANSPVGQGRFEETEGLHRQKPREPSKTIDVGLESPDAAHRYDKDSPKSSTSHAVELSTRQVSPLPQNGRPLEPQPDLSDLALYSEPDRDPNAWRITRKRKEGLYRTPIGYDGIDVKSIPLQSFSDSFVQNGATSKPRTIHIDTLSDSHKNALVRTIIETELATLSSTFSKYITTDTDLTKLRSDHVIPGLLDFQYSVDAIGDTGAKHNFLNEDYAKRCKFKIDSTSRRPITIASGQKVMTTGIAEVSFRFRDEQTPYPLKFHILPGCIKNIILGKSFLKATKTFSNALHFAKRVVKRFTRTLNTHQVLFLGASPPMFTGLLNGETKTALADSASKVLIMDEDYAQKLGLSIVSTKNTCIKLRFADGSTAFTSGKTYNVSWQFGTGKRFPLDFYILRNAPADVILSEDFLLRETKAFIEYADCLMEEEEDGDVGYYDDSDDDDFFFAIYRDENYHPQAYTEGADQYFEDDREDARRTEEDLHIASLIGDEKDAAIARAKERRAQWAAKQAANSLAQGSQNNTTNTASSSVTPQAQTSNAAGVPSTSKRQRWRFKLMKKRKAGSTGQYL